MTNPWAKQGLAVPFRSRHIAVFPDAAPLSPGHFLAIPHKHVLSLSGCSESVRDEIFSVSKDIASFLEKSYPEYRSTLPYFFEHGSTSENDIVGCIAHAHLQVLFGPPGFLHHVKSFGIFENYSSKEEAWNQQNGNAYYLIGDFENTFLEFRILEKTELECHFFLRKVYATFLGRSELADYRSYLDRFDKKAVDMISRTYDELLHYRPKAKVSL